MIKKVLILQPTADQTFILVGNGKEGDLIHRLNLSREEERVGNYKNACNERYKAFRLIVDSLPEDESVELDRNHPNTAAALEIIYGSSIDHFLIGDFELAAAQAEMLLDCDPEDSLNITPTLALCYIAIGEWDCFDDISMDLDDYSAIKPLLETWASFLRTGKADMKSVERLKRYPAFIAEILSSDHVADQNYLRDISSKNPSKETVARDLWLKCEPVLTLYPEFIEELKMALKQS